MNMKNKISKLVLIAFAGLSAMGCTGDFAEMNTNPKSIPMVAPEDIFYTAQREAHTSGEYWNSSATKGRWMRYGISNYFFHNNQSFEFMGDGTYGSYNSLGGVVTNIEYLADNHENAESYANLKAMTRILLISDGIHTSDVWGSLAYSGAWKARAGKDDEESLSPKFQTQEELSAVWDAELKECIETLKNSAEQMNPGSLDRAYGGDTAGWIKAANGIRLRLASRLLKRQPEVAKAIATEVLASGNAANVMSSPDDSFILWFENLFTTNAENNPGDWHSPKDLLLATATLIDFLEENGDPRLRMFFHKNNLTPQNIKTFNDWCKNTPEGRNYSKYDPDLAMDKQSPAFYTIYIPDGTPGLKTDRVFDLYEGATSDPSLRSSNPASTGRSLPASASPTGSAISMRPVNEPQVALFDGSENGNTGGNWFPTMTHADFCFLAAEFVLTEGISSSKSAQAWYEEGVKSSLDQWNALGEYCKIYDYTPMTDEEASAFMSKPDIAWAADAELQLEQIRIQAWVDNFKNYDEAWAQWKRTGMPGTETSIVTFEHVYHNHVELRIPRRAKFNTPDVGSQNEANLRERLDVMRQNPEFGDELGNEFGRHWWDKQ